ncbi:hypothetical protein BC833DRAFT_653302 [Globomyces pollinis-pini]|nr:hypothetical protein BC833DRAFT_653302 [Globomyces pollinis-pini]
MNGFIDNNKISLEKTLRKRVAVEQQASMVWQQQYVERAKLMEEENAILRKELATLTNFIKGKTSKNKSPIKNKSPVKKAGTFNAATIKVNKAGVMKAGSDFAQDKDLANAALKVPLGVRFAPRKPCSHRGDQDWTICFKCNPNVICADCDSIGHKSKNFKRCPKYNVNERGSSSDIWFNSD